MKCLYITSKPIYPIIDGGCFAMDSFLKTLSHAGFIIDHFTISTQKHPFRPDAYPEGIHVESVEIDTRIKTLQSFKYLFKKGSYNVARFHSEEVTEKIEAVIKKNTYDFVILDSLYATTYLSSIRKYFTGKIYLRSHNFEAQIWFDLAKNEQNIPKSIYFKKLAKDLHIYESTILNKLDGVFAISQEDQEAFMKNNTKAKVCVIPVHLESNDQDEFKIEKGKIFHVGNMDWVPNREAVERLVKLFHESIHSDDQLKLSLVGKNIEKHYKSSKGIEIQGFVDDLKGFVQKSGILVSPITSSSGVRVKILEMMAYGIPVITTPSGAKGIFSEGKNAVEIQETNTALIDAILRITKDDEKLAEMQTLSKEYIKKYHNIEQIASDLKSFILD